MKIRAAARRRPCLPPQAFGEGFALGLAWNGEHLILSDGTSTLRFLEPDSSEEMHSVTARDHRGPVDSLNELEWIDGKLHANRWHTDDILLIDPESGVVEAVLYLGVLVPRIPNRLSFHRREWKWKFQI